MKCIQEKQHKHDVSAEGHKTCLQWSARPPTWLPCPTWCWRASVVIIRKKHIYEFESGLLNTFISQFFLKHPMTATPGEVWTFLIFYNPSNSLISNPTSPRWCFSIRIIFCWEGCVTPEHPLILWAFPNTMLQTLVYYLELTCGISVGTDAIRCNNPPPQRTYLNTFLLWMLGI